MGKETFWFKRRKFNFIIGIPVIFSAFTAALGIYSIKVHVALQEYLMAYMRYDVVLPRGVFFVYESYVKVIIAAVIIAAFIGLLLSYSANILVNKYFKK